MRCLSDELNLHDWPFALKPTRAACAFQTTEAATAFDRSTVLNRATQPCDGEWDVMTTATQQAAVSSHFVRRVS